MIRPVSEIEYPPSEALRMKAAMIARMEALADSSNDFMQVIAQRVGIESVSGAGEYAQLIDEQDRLIANMKRLING